MQVSILRVPSRGVFARLCATLGLLLLIPPAGAATEELSGSLPDGTPWRVQKPDNWNGYLTLDLDFAGLPGAPPRPSPMRDWMLAQGYAMGGVAREPVGYDFPKAVDYLLTVRAQFVQRWGAPRHTLAVGNSRGAFVARKAMELHPEVFDGALISSGGSAGSIAVLNSKLDTVWALKTLVDAEAPLKLVNISDIKSEDAALSALLKKATADAQGRARLALALAFEQFPAWTVRTEPKPALRDYEAQLDQAIANFVFANPALVRAGVEKVAGGNVSWNEGIDYARLLQRSGSAERVRALYRKAGLKLDEDLRRLAAAPRIKADPAALKQVAPLVSYTGQIRGPIVNVDNDDPVDPAPLKLAYLDTLRAAGHADLHRLLWVDGAGHGGQTELDKVVGLTLLKQRIESGRWADTRLPALHRLAGELDAAAQGALGKDTFFDLHPAAPLRTWDARNWPVR